MSLHFSSSPSLINSVLLMDNDQFLEPWIARMIERRVYDRVTKKAVDNIITHLKTVINNISWRIWSSSQEDYKSIKNFCSIISLSFKNCFSQISIASKVYLISLHHPNCNRVPVIKNNVVHCPITYVTYYVTSNHLKL